MNNSLLFDAFFSLGKEESASPFLTPSARKWGKDLSLRSALLSAVFLSLSFLLSLFHPETALIPLLLLSVYFLAGVPRLIEALEDLALLQVNIDVLMVFAAFAAFLIGRSMEGALLLVLFSLAGAMEKFVSSKAKETISTLHKLTPSTATVVADGRLVEKAVADIPVKTEILIRAGQIVPLDGLVVSGISSVNLVHLTGENFPLIKKEGDSVAAGTLNIDGALVLKVTHIHQQSSLAKIIEHVTNAEAAKPKMEQLFQRFSGLYAKSIILLSIFVAALLPLWTDISWFAPYGSVYRALAFLIAASPCALIIALPIAYLSAINACAKNGILLKGGIFLEALAKCQAIAFDKTGTITTGELELVSIEPLTESSFSTLEALTLAATLEKNTIHPIAKSILRETEKRGGPPLQATSFKSVPGFGVEGTVLLNGKEHRLFIGRIEYIERQLERKQKWDLLIEKAKAKAYEKGELLSLLLVDDALFLFHFKDTLRPDVRAVIQKLQKKWNLSLLMLSGDHIHNAKKIGQEVGILDVHADLNPEEKMQWINALSHKMHLAMVGDGINDAPALARATVGIAMGKIGSSAAIDAADIVLLQDNLSSLDFLIEKAVKTKKIIRQNLSLAILAMLVAAIPALFGLTPIFAAVLLHEGGTILVGLNALRLLR